MHFLYFFINPWPVSKMLAKPHTLTQASYIKERELSDSPHSSGFIACFPSTTEGEKQEDKGGQTPGSHTPTYTKKERQLPLSIWQSHGYDTRIAQAHTHTINTSCSALFWKTFTISRLKLKWTALWQTRTRLREVTRWVHFNSRALKENFCHRCVSFLCFHVEICIVALYICQSNIRVIILYLV